MQGAVGNPLRPLFLCIVGQAVSPATVTTKRSLPGDRGSVSPQNCDRKGADHAVTTLALAAAGAIGSMKLRIMQRPIETITVQQFLVSAALDNSA